jgi:hypothetical protein
VPPRFSFLEPDGNDTHSGAIASDALIGGAGAKRRRGVAHA